MVHSIRSLSGTGLCLLALVVSCRPPPPPSVAPVAAWSRAEAAQPAAGRLEKADRLERNDLVCAVLERNPDLAAARAALQAARDRAATATSPSATRLSWSLAPASIGSNVAFGHIAEVEQSFRLGQAPLERRVAAAEADILAARWDVARNDLALAAVELYVANFETVRALETNAEHQRLVTELADAARARYSANLGSAEDPLQAELELGRIEQERIALQARRRTIVAQTNGLLHRAPDTALPQPPAGLRADRDVESTSLLRSEALATRPELVEATAEATVAERSEGLARRRFSPDLSVMASYNSMWSDVQHRFMLGIGVAVPLQIGALRANTRAAAAERRRANQARLATADRIAVDVETAHAGVVEAIETVELLERRLVPVANEWAEVARTGYENGANSLQTLIDAQRTLRSLELDHHRAIAEVQRRFAVLDRAAGRRPSCGKEGALP